MPIIHPGPNYPPEEAYFRKLISYESAVRCCRMNGHYDKKGENLANSHQEKINNLAFFIWQDGGKPENQQLQNWFLAESMIDQFEKSINSIWSENHQIRLAI